MSGGSGHAWFEYGSVYGSTYYATWPWQAGLQSTAGNSTTTLSTLIQGLAPNTNYHFNLKAENSNGGTTGQNLNFTTASVINPVPPPPTQNPIQITTNTLSAISVTNSSARIRGTFNMNGSIGHVWFEYGDTYGSTYYATWPWKAGVRSSGGNIPYELDVDLTGLSPHTTYHYNIKAENSFGGNQGQTLTFTTK